jgi:hypothetical protein
MSFDPTSWRPFARAGWGHRATFRGLQQTDKLGLTNTTIVNRGQVGTVVYRSPGGVANFVISGVSRDSSGVALGSCTIALMQTGGDILTQTTISDASGNFSFSNPGSGPFYLVAYKVGSPDVAGTTVDTLLPTAI